MLPFVFASFLFVTAYANISPPASSHSIINLLERFKRQSSCRALQYQCTNGQCILSYNVCDGPKDCADGSDETREACRALEIRNCPALSFQCTYGACIDRELRCNGKQDCADGSDEKDCTNASPPPTTCQAGSFQCSNGECIDQYEICDGVKNCQDGSDETRNLCKNLNCPASSFQCHYGACLPKSVKCNRVGDCPDGSDELDCEPMGIVTTRPPTVSTPTLSTAGGCLLPEQPRHGVYTAYLQCQPGDVRAACRNTPGTPVPSSWILKYSCNANYHPTANDEYSICDNGVWKSPLDCIKMCPPLKSPNVDVKCVFDRREVPCTEPMKPNTIATAKCKQWHKPVAVVEYSRLVCREDGEWSNSLFYCTPECGVPVKPENLTPLIIDGLPTYHGEFPWLSALYLRNDTGWTQSCGGALVTPHLVLTAAHCLVLKNGTKATPETLKVGLGMYYRDFYKCDTRSFISDVSDIITHRYYSGAKTYYAFDIALLNLASSVRVSEYIMPVCMDWATAIPVEHEATGYVAGFGTTENNTASDVVLSAQLKIIEHDTCINQLPKYQAIFVGVKLCAESIDKGQVAPGDSGGGMSMIKDGKHFLIGLVSTRIPGNAIISLFTDIRDHLPWLQENQADLERKHSSTPQPSQGGRGSQCSSDS